MKLQTPEGISYHIEASADLVDWSLPVVEETGVLDAGLLQGMPRLSDQWEYRIFRFPANGFGFFRTGVSGSEEP